MAYVQSDEISIILRKGEKEGSQIWFDGNVQKLCSLSAVIASLTFTKESVEIWGTEKPAMFDSRVFEIPSDVEVTNYLVWRQQDHMRNAVQMMARTLFSHKSLIGKKTVELRELVAEKGFSMHDQSSHHQLGRVVMRDPISGSWEIPEQTPHFVKVREQILGVIK